MSTTHAAFMSVSAETRDNVKYYRKIDNLPLLFIGRTLTATFTLATDILESSTTHLGAQFSGLDVYVCLTSQLFTPTSS